MQIMYILLVFLTILNSILANNDAPFYNVNDHEEVSRHFEEFIKAYERTYAGEEKMRRFKIFVENLKEINELNEDSDAVFGINNFADLSTEEKDMYSGSHVPESEFYPPGDCKILGDPTSRISPEAWDWREKGAVSPVKDQKACGSCWAFAATGLLESRNWRRGNRVLLSEQQMVDCDDVSYGCGGGFASWGLSKVILEGGQETDTDYPYKAKNGKCRFDSSRVATKVSRCTAYNLTSEDALKELLYKEGPIAIGVDARPWHHYIKGISRRCTYQRNEHAALLVGYGTDENNQDFWVIKNSWDKIWGEDGYIRIKRGVGCNGIDNRDPNSKVSAFLE